MKFIRIFLFILIVIGIVLISTQRFWVPGLVEKIMTVMGDRQMIDVEQATIPVSVKTTTPILYDGNILPLPNITFAVPDGWRLSIDNNHALLTQTTNSDRNKVSIRFHVIRMVSSDLESWMNQFNDRQNHPTVRSVSTSTKYDYGFGRIEASSEESDTKYVDYVFFDKPKAYVFAIEPLDQWTSSSTPRDLVNFKVFEDFISSTITSIKAL